MTPTTRITRLPEKASTDRTELDRLLDDVHIGHFGVIDDGQPVVIPTAIVRDGDRVLAHGSTGSRWMRALAAGAPTSLAITSYDGLVIARSAFESSMHYRSAVLFGSCTVVDDAAPALDVITEALIPGRVAELRRPRAKELAATLVLEFPIKTWSLKISAGWPEDPDDDIDGPAWAGVIPARVTHGAPIAAPDLKPGRPVPESVSRIAQADGTP
jgi:uncharacterized protein